MSSRDECVERLRLVEAYSRKVSAFNSFLERLGRSSDGRNSTLFNAAETRENIPLAWQRFMSDGVQRGICELIGPRPRRRFEYRAKANFAPGLHLSVLRELTDSGGPIDSSFVPVQR